MAILQLLALNGDGLAACFYISETWPWASFFITAGNDREVPLCCTTRSLHLLRKTYVFLNCTYIVSGIRADPESPDLSFFGLRFICCHAAINFPIKKSYTNEILIFLLGVRLMFFFFFLITLTSAGYFNISAYKWV